MNPKAQEELLKLLQDAIKVGGAALEMRTRRFASLVRPSDESLASAIAPLVAGNAQHALRRAQPQVAAPVDADSKLPLVRTDPADMLRAEPLLTDKLKKQVDQLLLEHQSADRLLAAGFAPAKSVLLSGPPGVGKTMTAGWLASRLGLPLLTLDLASVMSSYLGKTGANVRAVLSHAQEQPCVLLLDEFDAIAKRRDDDSDVGELKRLVTVILQTIDDWQPTSLLVAATNHSDLLDPAVWRRFDVTLQFDLPNHAQRTALLVAGGVDPELAQVIAQQGEGRTLATLNRTINSAHKSALLNNTEFHYELCDMLLRHLESQEPSAKQLRDQRDLETFIKRKQGLTLREIADELKVSHTTVKRSIDKIKEGLNG